MVTTAAAFEEVLSKLRWAGHQISALDIAVADYIGHKPYVTVIEDHPEAEAYRVVAHLRYPPPASIAHIVGDVLNSLHGTLDYLAHQLVLREEGTPDNITAFPIVKATEEGGSEPAINIYRKGPKGKREPLISDPEVIDLLRDVQPYRLPPAVRHLDWLLLLRKLNGKSKHRHPAVVTSAIDQGHYVYRNDALVSILPDVPGVPREERSVAHYTTNFMPLNDGDEMAWVPYAWAPEDGLPEHDDFTTFVALEEASVYPRTGEPFPVVAVMTDLMMFIDTRILVPFAPLFGVTVPVAK